MRVDLLSGIARIVNAGHPPPIRIRDGHAEEVALLVDQPFGWSNAGDYRVQEMALEAGDRLFFLTDGMLERQASSVDVPSRSSARVAICIRAKPCRNSRVQS